MSRVRRASRAALGTEPRAVVAGVVATLAFSGVATVFGPWLPLPANAFLLGGVPGGFVASYLASWRWTVGVTVGARAAILGFVLYQAGVVTGDFVHLYRQTGDLMLYWAPFTFVLYGLALLPVFVLGGLVGGLVGSQARAFASGLAGDATPE